MCAVIPRGARLVSAIYCCVLWEQALLSLAGIWQWGGWLEKERMSS